MPLPANLLALLIAGARRVHAGARRVHAGVRGLARRVLGADRPPRPFVGAYGRSIVVGATAGLLVVVIAVLVARSCGGRHAAASERAAEASGAPSGSQPPGKRLAVDGPTGRRPAR